MPAALLEVLQEPDIVIELYLVIREVSAIGWRARHRVLQWFLYQVRAAPQLKGREFLMGLGFSREEAKRKLNRPYLIHRSQH